MAESGPVYLLIRSGKFMGQAGKRLESTFHHSWKIPGYDNWRLMKDRCYNPNNASYYLYGARGITVCQQWMDSFRAFLDDVGVRPSPTHTIDRYPNKNGNYEPGNVRWATPKEQAANRHTTHSYTWNGMTKTLTEWAAFLGVRRKTLKERRHKGWPMERVLSEPIGSCRNRPRGEQRTV